jgi:2-polyprenyl-6-methoxyphenol hydroxylase-like FAD-dependent oxidoreductase
MEERREYSSMATDVNPATQDVEQLEMEDKVLDVQRTTCCVVGGGPGGAVLALLLACKGIDVTLLEAHDDFDRITVETPSTRRYWRSWTSWVWPRSCWTFPTRRSRAFLSRRPRVRSYPSTFAVRGPSSHTLM